MKQSELPLVSVIIPAHNSGPFIRHAVESVICHIPHGGSPANLGLPLWARKTPTGPYTLYGVGSTTAGTTVNNPGTFSLTCLSCHDGTIGVGTTAKNGVDTTYAMTGNVDANGRLVYNPATMGTSNPVVGTDLANAHHVVGIAFPLAGYGANGGVPGISLTVKDSGLATARLVGAFTSRIYIYISALPRGHKGLVGMFDLS